MFSRPKMEDCTDKWPWFHSLTLPLAAGVLQLKGRAACEVDTADELMASELMLEGAFGSLNIHQVVAITSCLVPVEKSQTQVDVQPELKDPLKTLQETAGHIATVSIECGLELDEEEYVQR